MFSRLTSIARKTLFSCTQQQKQPYRYQYPASIISRASTATVLDRFNYSTNAKNKTENQDAMAAPVNTTSRLERLRHLMASSKHNLSVYVVPSEDAHQSEYVAACDERRAFISGFDGSAGCAVVTADKALMFTDGRYFLQARQQMDDNWTLMKSGVGGVPTWQEYIATHLPSGSRVGIDPTLVSVATATDLQTRMGERGVELVALSDNLVDACWNERPVRPTDLVFVHDAKYAGESHADKIRRVRDKAAAAGAQGIVVSALDEVAWLLNLRGSDISFNPVFFAYVVVTNERVSLYIDEQKLDSQVRSHLQGIDILPYSAIFEEMRALAAATTGAPAKLLAGPSVSWALAQALGDKIDVTTPSPLPMLKALKNAAELDGMRNCHVRDGAAMAEFFGWLENELLFNNGHLRLTESDVADKLETLRRAQPLCVGLSFDTISSVGANGAIIHYKPTRGHDALLDINQMFLLDSGGQYRDGTTDVTRTVHFGTPSAWQRECFTRVLKGHIALDRAVFPAGTSGYVLDPLARMPLWEVGLDFRHGTGHGVGSFLCVHEGPQGVSMRKSVLDSGFQHGMTITNEPGYYEDGAFGIRIENTCLVVKTDTPYDYTGGTGYLTFEPVTMVPIQKKLVQAGMLSAEERLWLDRYHAKVWESVSPLLEKDSLGYNWLKRETSPL
ncbi:hypothetical protein IW150_000944 [Coemansia sp. RSA 2607]|nr:hypothetical protein IW150_000944 [Coemansia sp. RSA 2607]